MPGVVDINLPTDPKAVATIIKRFNQRPMIIHKLRYLNEDIKRVFDYKQELEFGVLFDGKYSDFAHSTDEKIYKLMWYFLAFSVIIFIIFNAFSALFNTPPLSTLPPVLYVLLLLYEVNISTKEYRNKTVKENRYKLQIVYYKFAQNMKVILSLVSVLSAFQVLITSAMIFTFSNFTRITEILNIAIIASFVIAYLYFILKIYYFLLDAKTDAEDLLLDIGSKNINLKIVTNYNKVISGKLTGIGEYLRLESKNYKFAVDWSDIKDVAVHK